MEKDKKTIIVLGVGPTPTGNPDKVYAPGLRLFAFSKLILQAGFNVIMGEASFDGDAPALVSKELIEPNWERRRLPLDPLSSAAIVDKWVREMKPAALVSSTDVMNRTLSFLDTDIPRWMDFFGHPMTERQEIGYIHQNDAGLIDQWLYIIPSLLTGDRFSTCSTPQKHALIGELGGVGRLNRHNSGEDIVAVIKQGAVFHEPAPGGERAFRGDPVPEDAFCLLWSGGFNTWVDEKTLYEGVSLAMNESEKIRFIVTGGEIRKHNEITFENFRKRVEEGPFRARFHFFGWVPLKRLSSFYAESNAAINIDRFTYEAVLGIRNRVFSWMNFNLPVITTPLSENTMDLVTRNLAVGFSPGNPRELADGVMRIMKNPDMAREMAAKAKERLLEEYDYSKTIKPLIDWLEHPGKALDLSKKKNVFMEFENERGITVPDNSLSVMQGLIALDKDLARQIERKARASIEKSRGIKNGAIAKRLKRFMRLFEKK